MLVVVVSTLAIAQNVQIAVVSDNSLYRSSSYSLGQFEQSKVHLSERSVITSISGDVRFGCSGDVALCAVFDDDLSTQVCATPSKPYFDISPTLAENITFSSQTGNPFCNNRRRRKGFLVILPFVQISNLDIRGGQGTIITRPLFSLDSDQPVLLGRAGSLAKASPGESITVKVSDNRAVAWFTQRGLLSPTSTLSTSNLDDEVVACLNTDGNFDSNGPICDYKDARKCTIKASTWLLGDCCGDVPYSGCSFYSDKQAFCGTSSRGIKTWAALERVGSIVDLGQCPGVSVVSNGSLFFTCQPTPEGFDKILQLSGREIIAGHEYLCDGEEIVECGGDAPYSENGAKTGDRRIIEGKVNYCTSQGSWAISLDEFGRDSCERAGLSWTGSRCCGEADDPVKTYEEVNANSAIGACINNRFVASGKSVPGASSAVNYRGVFYKCDVNASTPLLDEAGIIPKLKEPCGLPLKNAVLTGSKRNLVCTVDGRWMLTSSDGEHFSKVIRWSSVGNEKKNGCCPENECWDGVECIKKGEVRVRGGKGFRCA
ncbi:hypothetical protein D6825_02440 [Candidatus Woesearchaeota archaeon]|nr:MAG: hypothetical protein D6825_02440 [Candidatus Woesearchaeota archaeon]